MSKTGLFGFGYINETVFYSKLSELIGREVTNRDKQSIGACVQKQLDKGSIEYFTFDWQENLHSSRTAPANSREILAKCVSIGMKDAKGQELYAYICQQPGSKWSTIYVGTRPQICTALEAYHIGYLNFKNFRLANEFICQIHDVLLPGEQWGFSKEGDNPALIRRATRYQILESYLRHTFSKLMLEYNDASSDNYGKIVFSQDKRYCYFNTGLLTRYAQDLYLTGEVKHLKSTGIFTCDNPRFVDSKIELVKLYGFAQRDIDPGPGVASFFRSISDIVYDPSVTIDFTESKLEHIIDDGIRRNRFPRKYTVSATGAPIPPWSLAQMLNNSIKIACMMAQRNYKYVIPQYRPAGVEYIGGKKVMHEGQIQFLMPIYLSADYFSPPDFALVLSRKDGFYVPETILLLPWAYNNARILCKPDNSWLTPSAINPEDLLLDEEEAELTEEGYDEVIPDPVELSPLPEEPAKPEPAPKKKEKPQKNEKKASEPKKQEPAKQNKKEKKPEQPAAPVKEETPAAGALAGQVLHMNFTGTTASKALRAQHEETMGTISAKKLGGHKAMEFHGLSALVRLISLNSNGEAYQCEFAEEIDAVLARRKDTKSDAPAKSAKAEKSENNPAAGSWAWANPANVFTQHAIEVESFSDLSVGQRYNATVRDFVPYGVFVDIGYAEGNVLLHKSQIAEGVQLQQGDVIPVWIHALDQQHKKVQVTMRRPD